MQLTPVKDDFAFEVMNADKWLEQLDIAISSGEIYIEELGLLIGRYPNAGDEPPYYESAAELLIEHLIPHRHPEAMTLLDNLYKAYKQKAADVLLKDVVHLCAEINDPIGGKKAHEALLTRTSAWRLRISEARRQSGRERGSKAPKTRHAIAQQYVQELIAKNPSMTSPQAWQSIWSEDDPDDRREPLKIGKYELYRALVEREERLVQYHIPSKTSPDISYNTFRGYVTKAKKFTRALRTKKGTHQST